MHILMKSDNTRIIPIILLNMFDKQKQDAKCISLRNFLSFQYIQL